MDTTISQLGYCNAHIVTSRKEDRTIYTLISYSTRVVDVIVFDNGTTDIICGTYFGCSRTTGKQVRRFLRWLDLDFYLTGLAKKDIKEGNGSFTGQIYPLTDSVNVAFMDGWAYSWNAGWRSYADTHGYFPKNGTRIYA